MLHRASIGLVVAIAILLAGQLAAAPQTAPGAKNAPGAVVNINTASAEQLDSLPGVGPQLAARIIEYRQKNGGFKKIEDLMNVRGIGEKNFLKLKPLITVAPAKAGAPASGQ